MASDVELRLLSINVGVAGSNWGSRGSWASLLGAWTRAADPDLHLADVFLLQELGAHPEGSEKHFKELVEATSAALEWHRAGPFAVALRREISESTASETVPAFPNTEKEKLQGRVLHRIRLQLLGATLCIVNVHVLRGTQTTAAAEAQEQLREAMALAEGDATCGGLPIVCGDFNMERLEVQALSSSWHCLGESRDFILVKGWCPRLLHCPLRRGFGSADHDGLLASIPLHGPGKYQEACSENISTDSDDERCYSHSSEASIAPTAVPRAGQLLRPIKDYTALQALKPMLDLRRSELLISLPPPTPAPAGWRYGRQLQSSAAVGWFPSVLALPVSGLPPLLICIQSFFKDSDEFLELEVGDVLLPSPHPETFHVACDCGWAFAWSYRCESEGWFPSAVVVDASSFFEEPEEF